MKYKYIIVLIQFCFLIIKSQNSEITELRNRISKVDNDSAAKCYARMAYLSTQISPDTVLYYAQKALKISSNTNPAKGDAIIQIGNSFSMRQKNDSAFFYYNRALLFFKSINYERGIAKAEQSFAVVYRNIEDLDNSNIRARNALSIYKKINWPLGIINTYNLLSQNFVFKKQIDSALFYVRSSLALVKTTSDSSKYFQIQKQYADVLFRANKLDSSMFYLKNCSGFMHRNGNIGEVVSIERSLGFINLVNLSNTIAARQNFMNALALSEKYQLKNEYKEILYGLYSSYINETGNKDSITKYLVKYQMWMDTLNSNEHMKFIRELQTKYETEKKELQIKSQSIEIDAQEKQNKQKSLIILFGTLALVGTGFFAAMAFINFRKTKKANIIIENQKQQVELKNEEVTHQKEIVEEKQKEIIDSINYAKRIQQAVLTGEDVWNKISKEYFILFKPKDIVSGDFYWAYNTLNNRSVFALADCTGHGVPGGFMSMLGNSFLNEIVVENKIFKANEILNKLRSKIINALEQKGGIQQKDGMDISLCVWNKIDNTLEFAGANNPLWILRDKEIREYKADKMPIGTYLETEVPFSSVTIELQTGDIIYLSTDGYADQFGGPKGKKLKYKPLMESLIVNSPQDMASQKGKLEQAFNLWQGTNEQVDDVSIIGIRV